MQTCAHIRERLIRRLERESLAAERETVRIERECVRPRGIFGWLGYSTSLGYGEEEWTDWDSAHDSITGDWKVIQ